MNSQLTSVIGICSSINNQNITKITGLQGLYGTIGITGLQGTSGPGGFQITDWKDELMKKYPRFNIKTEYDAMTFSPTNIIIDNNTGVEYKLNHIRQASGFNMNEVEQFIQELIVTIRDEKINNIINGH